ncbi:MAG: hypothetical protein IPM26_06480 [Saprospiraceae bacterium]|nr:hypothetical protein [Saprospiraceae bacterium]
MNLSKNLRLTLFLLLISSVVNVYASDCKSAESAYKTENTNFTAKNDISVNLQLGCHGGPANIILFPSVYIKTLKACNGSTQHEIELRFDMESNGVTEYIASTNFPESWVGFWHFDTTDGVYKTTIKKSLIKQASRLELPEIHYNSGEYYHTCSWKLSNPCNENVQGHNAIIGKDKKPPIPIVAPEVYNFGELDKNGVRRFLFNARDLNLKSYDDCTEEENLLFTFDYVKPQIESKWVFGQEINKDIPHYFDKSGGLLKYPADTTKKLQNNIVNLYKEGKELTKGNGPIQLWWPQDKSSSKYYNPPSGATDSGEIMDIMTSVWDENFNGDYSWTKFRLFIFCCLPKYITGRTTDLFGKAVSNVEVGYYDINYKYSFYFPSDGQGSYSLSLHCSKYILDAKYSPSRKSGITLDDYLTLKDHLNGVKPFPNPYYYIAADINRDREVNYTDLTLMKKILQSKNENTPAEFITIPFTDALKISNWHEYRLDTLVNSDYVHGKTFNFITIELGKLVPRANECYTSSLNSDIYTTVNAGEVFSILLTDITQKQLNQYSSLFYTEQLEILKIQNETLFTDLRNEEDKNGVVKIHWLNRDNFSQPKVFQCKVYLKALAGGKLSDFLIFENTPDNGHCPVEKRLQIRRESNLKDRGALSVESNGWDNTVTVKYNADASSQAQLIFYDLTGNQIYRLNEWQLTEGINEISVPLPSLQTGIFFTQLYSGKEKKMVKWMYLK